MICSAHCMPAANCVITDTWVKNKLKRGTNTGAMSIIIFLGVAACACFELICNMFPLNRYISRGANATTETPASMLLSAFSSKAGKNHGADHVQQGNDAAHSSFCCLNSAVPNNTLLVLRSLVYIGVHGVQ